MLIKTVSVISDEKDVGQYAWEQLDQYKNVEFVTERLIALHQVPEQHRRNVKKQARQIRYCVSLAKEYRSAADVASLATRPVHLYYSTMHLALAEILLKQTGDSGLDKARAQHRHHGLLADIRSIKGLSLVDAAANLKAKPMISSAGDRRGTFELWHRSCRHLPIVGQDRVDLADGTFQTSCGSVLTEKDERLPALPLGGMTLLECFQMMPGLGWKMPFVNIPPRLARGQVSRRYSEKKQEVTHKIIVHPYIPTLVNEVFESFSVPPRWINEVDIKLGNNAFIVIHTAKVGENWPSDPAVMPNAFNSNAENAWFFSEKVPMNEFGYLYVGLFICASLARYYPDLWMVEISRDSDLSLGISAFLRLAARRIAVLALSELTRTYFIEE
jgi:hypothetical protein